MADFRYALKDAEDERAVTDLVGVGIWWLYRLSCKKQESDSGCNSPIPRHR